MALFDEKSAIDAMMANPLLIRRPLMEWDSVKMAGFDANEVRAKLGLDLENLPQDSCSMQRAEAH